MVVVVVVVLVAVVVDVTVVETVLVCAGAVTVEVGAVTVEVGWLTVTWVESEPALGGGPVVTVLATKPVVADTTNAISSPTTNAVIAAIQMEADPPPPRRSWPQDGQNVAPGGIRVPHSGQRRSADASSSVLTVLPGRGGGTLAGA